MSSEDEHYRDPLIDEVRQRRRELFAKYDNDLHKLCEVIQRCQAQHPEKSLDRRKPKAPTG